MMELYQTLVRPLLFRLEPEKAHQTALLLGQNVFVRRMLAWLYSVPQQHSSFEIAGLRFNNRVGIAAGCDKDGVAIALWSALGCGHVEVGTVTPKPQPGNPGPRVFRLPEDCGLINRMGFPSQGMQLVRKNLERARESVRDLPIIGINLGKNKDTELVDAARDYVTVLTELSPVADYITLNVSSPNTPELRKLQEPTRLRALFEEVQAANRRRLPLFVKISPDLEESDVASITSCALDLRLAGIVATNTTVSRPKLRSGSASESGGLSGAPLTERARGVVAWLRTQVGRNLAIVGVGGVLSGADGRALVAAGADLVQIYTGLVYRGPGLLREVDRALDERNAP